MNLRPDPQAAALPGGAAALSLLTAGGAYRGEGSGLVGCEAHSLGGPSPGYPQVASNSRTPAVAVDEPELTRTVLVENEVLAEEAHRLDRDPVELALACDRLPVAPKKIAHRASRLDAQVLDFERIDTDTGDLEIIS